MKILLWLILINQYLVITIHQKHIFVPHVIITWLQKTNKQIYNIKVNNIRKQLNDYNIPQGFHLVMQYILDCSISECNDLTKIKYMSQLILFPVREIKLLLPTEGNS